MQRTGILVGIGFAAALAAVGGQAMSAGQAHSEGWKPRLAAVSVPFVPNAGQWDRQAAFAAHTFAGTVFVTTHGALVYSFPGRTPAREAEVQSVGLRATPGYGAQDAGRRESGWVISETFIGDDRHTILATPRGTQVAAAKVAYVIGGDSARHRQGLDTFERIDLGNVFRGINVQLRASGRNVEKIFTVAPHENPARIALRIAGAAALQLGTNGELMVRTDNGPIVYTAPVAYQEDHAGNREPVGVRYALDGISMDYGFAVDAYDAERPLIIDPLLQSTYLGAANLDQAVAVAIHPFNGDVYVAGTTAATTNTFPGTTGAAQPLTGGGTSDVFISRFNADLTTLVRSTYLGAGGAEEAAALAIHPVTGDIYVTGRTSSTFEFPGMTGGAQPGSGGGTDAFVSRLSADLGTVVMSSYLGAGGADQGKSIAVHPLSGDVYVAGFTTSTGTTFPGVGGGAQGSSGGGIEAFVSRFNPGLTTLIKSTYLGGSGTDSANVVTIHPFSGEILVAGSTTSTTFPGVLNGAQQTVGGSTDAFVSRLSIDLTAVLQSTYIGGTASEVAHSLAIHPGTGEIYIAGSASAEGLPGVAGGAQSIHGQGARDAFISRLSADLATLLGSTYQGGSGDDVGAAVAIHPVSGEVLLAGSTTSTADTFPGVSGSAQPTNGGATDAYLSRFTGDLKTLIRTSYLGAGGTDLAGAITVHPLNGQLYVSGATTSTGTSFPGVAGGARGTASGDFDAFVSRLSLDLQSADVLPDPFRFTAQAGVPVNTMRTSAPVRITGLGALATARVSGALGSALCVSTTDSCTCNASPGGLFSATPTMVAESQFVCVRHVSAPTANELRETFVAVGGGSAKFQTFTGDNFTTCTLDFDGNGSKDALTDGLLLLRALLGLTGTSATNGAIGLGATRTTWAQIQTYLNGSCASSFAP